MTSTIIITALHHHRPHREPFLSPLPLWCLKETWQQRDPNLKKRLHCFQSDLQCYYLSARIRLSTACRFQKINFLEQTIPANMSSHISTESLASVTFRHLRPSVFCCFSSIESSLHFLSYKPSIEWGWNKKGMWDQQLIIHPSFFIQL